MANKQLNQFNLPQQIETAIVDGNRNEFVPIAKHAFRTKTRTDNKEENRRKPESHQTKCNIYCGKITFLLILNAEYRTRYKFQPQIEQSDKTFILEFFSSASSSSCSMRFFSKMVKVDKFMGKMNIIFGS